MKKAVMYGAGNIGRGFIGQLFAQSGYEVTFIDVNQALVDQMNHDRAYPIQIVSETGNSEVIVSNVCAINGRDQAVVARAISETDIMATAVGVPILPFIARPIAEGLAKRWLDGHAAPLNIIICENLIDANHYLKELVKKELPADIRDLLDERAGFVEASVGRMVPVMTPEMQAGSPLRVFVEPFCELPVDRDGFRGEIPQIQNMIPASPFEFYIQRKLYVHNMGHALLAYLGQLKGYTYVWEAVQDPDIESICRTAMYASALALSREHGVAYNETKDFVDDLLERFENRQLGDTVERVGRDIRRKLAPEDRLVGAMNLCLKQRVDPTTIVLGIQAALNCSRKEQDNALESINLQDVSKHLTNLMEYVYAY